MISKKNLKNLSFLIYGLGLTGKSVVNFFIKNNIRNFKVWDDHNEDLYKNNRTSNLLKTLQSVDYIILSPGVSLAKSIINDPKVLLLDEPTASLDPETGDYVRSFLEEYQKEHGASILLASHNMSEVERLCSSVFLMNKGSIIAQGSPKKLVETHRRKNMEEVFLKLTREKL